MSATPGPSPALSFGRKVPASGTAGAGSKPARATVKPRPLPERSREAKQRAALILEVLAGARNPTEAARTLGVSLTGYYHLEERALAGLVAACELPGRGRGVSDGRRCVALERECQRWRNESARQQALVRAVQRTIGLVPPTPPPPKDKGKKRRRRRPVVRALQAVARLRDGQVPQENSAADPSTAAPTGS